MTRASTLMAYVVFAMTLREEGRRVLRTVPSRVELNRRLAVYRTVLT